ncbi:hypothetical protein PM082_010714 [Marasmius tenuissimus]|nr:hypothetical protein PM082_010714 [Marasmius tenuissimus]
MQLLFLCLILLLLLLLFLRICLSLLIYTNSHPLLMWSVTKYLLFQYHLFLFAFSMVPMLPLFRAWPLYLSFFLLETSFCHEWPLLSSQKLNPAQVLQAVGRQSGQAGKLPTETMRMNEMMRTVKSIHERKAGKSNQTCIVVTDGK